MNFDDGGVIRRGYNAELDELTTLAHSAKEWVANMQKKERERTGISSLKIGFNNVFGYYIEITHTHKDKVPAEYIRKQTMTNAERFITPELKEYEEKILHAEEKILALETTLFNELRMLVASHAGHPAECPADRRGRLPCVACSGGCRQPVCATGSKRFDAALYRKRATSCHRIASTRGRKICFELCVDRYERKSDSDYYWSQHGAGNLPTCAKSV